MIVKSVVVVLIATGIFSLVAVQSVDGDACNSTDITGSSSSDDDHEASSGVSSYAGIFIALFANAFNGAGMSLQKVGHNRVAAKAGGHERVDMDSTAHFKEPYWWGGLLGIIIGEGGNTVAYALAPASVIVPFGGVGVLTNYLLAVTMLGEKWSVQSLVGVSIIVTGVVLITLAVPESNVAYTAHELLSEDVFLSHRAFWYIMSLMCLVMLIAVKLEKDYAERYIIVWAVYASVVSSMTVLSLRGLGSMIGQIPSDCVEQCLHDELHWPCQSTLGHWLFWLSAIVLGLTAYWANGVIEQKGMMKYGQIEWVPLHYCVFTLFSIAGGAMVYNELAGLSASDWALFLSGGLCAIGGVVVLSSKHRLVCGTAPLSCLYVVEGDAYSAKSIDEKVDAMRLQRQSTRDLYSPGGAFAQMSLDIISEASSSSTRKSRLEDAHFPGSAAAARAIAITRPQQLPFDANAMRRQKARLLSCGERPLQCPSQFGGASSMAIVDGERKTAPVAPTALSVIEGADLSTPPRGASTAARLEHSA